MQVRVWGLLGALLWVGCSNGIESADCPGSRPVFADCVSGPTWAECGGTGSSPLFACSETGWFVSGCRWFAGGCVAEGFVASSCPVDDACCFEDSAFEPGAASSNALGAFTHEWGPLAWDRTLGRVVEASLAPLEAAEPSIACTGALEGDFRRCSAASRGPEFVSGAGESYWAVVRTTSEAILFWQLVVEVTRDDDGSLHARVCHTQTTDISGDSCTAGEGSPDCAVAGTLLLDAIPSESRGAPDATTRMDLSVTFADGSTLAMRL